MQAEVSELLCRIDSGEATFQDVLNFIDARYVFTPTAFENGEKYSAAGQHSGACRVLYYAKINQLAVMDALTLFAEHYKEFLASPVATTHHNIRAFNTYGWMGIRFYGTPLTAKPQEALAQTIDHSVG